MPYDDNADRPGGGSDIGPRAVAFMRAHLGEPLTTADLAGALGVSQRTLRRAMCAFAGMSPSRALALIRVAEAERLLADGAKVDVVALSVGFRSRATLYRLFETIAGRSVADCRRRQESAVPNPLEAGTPLAGGARRTYHRFALGSMARVARTTNVTDDISRLRRQVAW